MKNYLCRSDKSLDWPFLNELNQNDIGRINHRVYAVIIFEINSQNN
jgi:hypothetical protein